MALVFPSVTDTQAAIARGSGRLYWGTYIASGADTASSPVNDLGPTLNGIEFDAKRTLALIQSDQWLNPLGGFPSAEDFEFKTTLLHDNLKTHYDAWGTMGGEATAANVLTGGTVGSPAGTLTFGESSARRYMQLIWRGPGPGDTVTRTVQLWRVSVSAIGAIKFEKGKERSVQVTWKAFTDPTAYAAGNGAIGKMIDA